MLFKKASRYPMPISQTSAIERIARVLAGQRVSANAEGAETSAGTRIDTIWPSFLDEAVAIPKVLREPDSEMAAAGDVRIWEAMVGAGLAVGVSGSDNAPAQELRSDSPSTDEKQEGFGTPLPLQRFD
jgi:hypothetical protein